MKKARLMHDANISVLDYLTSFCYYYLEEFELALKFSHSVEDSFNARILESASLYQLDRKEEAISILEHFRCMRDPLVEMNFAFFRQSPLAVDILDSHGMHAFPFRYNFACMLLDKGCYGQILTLEAEDEDELFVKANALVGLHQLDEANEIFKYLAAQSVDIEIKKSCAGMVRYLKGDFIGALVEWELVRANEPNYAECLASVGRHEEAIKVWRSGGESKHGGMVKSLLVIGKGEEAYQECMQNACMLEIFFYHAYSCGEFFLAFKAACMIFSAGRDEYIPSVRAAAIGVFQHTVDTGLKHGNLDHVHLILKSIGTEFSDIVTAIDQWINQQLI